MNFSSAKEQHTQGSVRGPPDCGPHWVPQGTSALWLGILATRDRLSRILNEKSVTTFVKELNSYAWHALKLLRPYFPIYTFNRHFQKWLSGYMSGYITVIIPCQNIEKALWKWEDETKAGANRKIIMTFLHVSTLTTKLQQARLRCSSPKDSFFFFF